jgi:hypothetical protein
MKLFLFLKIGQLDSMNFTSLFVVSEGMVQLPSPFHRLAADTQSTRDCASEPIR